jgi:hypothetical protein
MKEMRVFAFDPADFREQYAEQGWLHIQQGVTPEFSEALKDFADREFGSHQVEGRAIAGAKTQALYEFPEGALDEVFDVVAATCGLERATMTLSERHVKWYDADADPNPNAHKDRLASQVSMGISIEVPEGSHLVLYPEVDVGVNPYNVSGALPKSLDPAQRPEVLLRDVKGLEIHDQPGDVMMFRGSAMWHLRRRPAGAKNLYLKLNDFNSDPLGEDPMTPARREATLDAVRRSEAAPDGTRVLLGRRMDSVARIYTRNGEEILQADVWGEDPVELTEQQLRAIRALDRSQTLGALVQELARNGIGADEARADLVALAQRGVLDLIG